MKKLKSIESPPYTVSSKDVFKRDSWNEDSIYGSIILASTFSSPNIRRTSGMYNDLQRASNRVHFWTISKENLFDIIISYNKCYKILV